MRVRRDIPVRMRRLFPFVEPGFEIDMRCQICDGKGCPACHGTGVGEVMPAVRLIRTYSAPEA